MRNVPAIDSTAIHALRDLVRRTRQDGTVVYFSDVQAQPLLALLLWELGEENLFSDIDEAVALLPGCTSAPTRWKKRLQF